jgi:hypothetical protein
VHGVSARRPVAVRRRLAAAALGLLALLCCGCGDAPKPAPSADAAAGPIARFALTGRDGASVVADGPRPTDLPPDATVDGLRVWKLETLYGHDKSALPTSTIEVRFADGTSVETPGPVTPRRNGDLVTWAGADGVWSVGTLADGRLQRLARSTGSVTEIRLHYHE